MNNFVVTFTLAVELRIDIADQKEAQEEAERLIENKIDSYRMNNPDDIFDIEIESIKDLKVD